MSGFNQNIMQMIEDLQNLSFCPAGNDPVGDKDPYGFPFEPIDAFSTKPLEFLETTMRLQMVTASLYGTLRRVNRQSPLYLRLSGHLERLVSILAGCCITKAVLEQQGNDFPLLKTLTIEFLREMLAFNFRKCAAAHIELHTVDPYTVSNLGLFARWANLDKRLIATGEKIEKIRNGVLCILPETAVEKADSPAETDENHSTGTEKPNRVHAFAPKGRSFSIQPGAMPEGTRLARQPRKISETTEDGIPEAETYPKFTEETDPEPVPVTDGDEPYEPEVFDEDEGYAEIPAIPDQPEKPIPYVSPDLVRRMAEYYANRARITAPENQPITIPIPQFSPP